MSETARVLFKLERGVVKQLARTPNLSQDDALNLEYGLSLYVENPREDREPLLQDGDGLYIIAAVFDARTITISQESMHPLKSDRGRLLKIMNGSHDISVTH